MDGYSIGYMLLFLLGLLVAVLWFFLPFAVFGIKDRLDTLIERVEQNTAALQKLRDGN